MLFFFLALSVVCVYYNACPCSKHSRRLGDSGQVWVVKQLKRVVCKPKERHKLLRQAIDIHAW
jgi:hypothetical protein